MGPKTSCKWGYQTLIFQFPIYLEPGGLVTWYIGNWELGSKYKGNWKIRERYNMYNPQGNPKTNHVIQAMTLKIPKLLEVTNPTFEFGSPFHSPSPTKKGATFLTQNCQVYISDAPCMEYLPTFGEKWLHSRGNVGKYSLHGAFGYFRPISQNLFKTVVLSVPSVVSDELERGISRHRFGDQKNPFKAT